MPLIPFEELPDRARLWTFAASRRLTDPEAVRFLAAAEEFLAGWAAHRVPLATAREWRFNQFLFVAADEAAAGASGCSIDALVRFIREAERQLEVRFTDHGSVWFRASGGAIECASREEFKQLVDQGVVGPDTVVFDNTIQTAGALRNGRWEVPARRSWHGRAFFSDYPSKSEVTLEALVERGYPARRQGEDLPSMGELIKVARLSEMPPGTCRHVDAGGRAVAVFNVDGTIYAIGGTCTHKGGPLGEGELDGTIVTCPWHDAQFDVTTGQVVGPPAEQSVPAYTVVVEGGDIKVDVSEGAS